MSPLYISSILSSSQSDIVPIIQFEGTARAKVLWNLIGVFRAQQKRPEHSELKKNDRKVGMIVLEGLLSDSKDFGFYLKCDRPLWSIIV